jgi:GH35 family endo-1,4-beta-xylanase
VDATIAAFHALGVKVNITELDVDVLPRVTARKQRRYPPAPKAAAAANPYTAGLPAQQQQALADRYAALFGVFLKHRDAITRVTFWGVTDRQFLVEQLSGERQDQLSPACSIAKASPNRRLTPWWPKRAKTRWAPDEQVEHG